MPIRLSLLLFGWFCGSAVYAACAYFDPRAGISFPETIGDFYFDERIEYGPTDLGYGMNYRTVDGIRGTVIVYDLGLADIQNGTQGQRVQAEILQAHNDIRFAAEHGYYESVDTLDNVSGFPNGFRRMSYSIIQEGYPPLRSHLLLRGQNGHFIKVRATGPDNLAIDDSVSAFARQLLEVLDPADDAETP